VLALLCVFFVCGGFFVRVVGGGCPLFFFSPPPPPLSPLASCSPPWLFPSSLPVPLPTHTIHTPSPPPSRSLICGSYPPYRSCVPMSRDGVACIVVGFLGDQRKHVLLTPGSQEYVPVGQRKPRQKRRRRPDTEMSRSEPHLYDFNNGPVSSLPQPTAAIYQHTACTCAATACLSDCLTLFRSAIHHVKSFNLHAQHISSRQVQLAFHACCRRMALCRCLAHRASCRRARRIRTSRGSRQLRHPRAIPRTQAPGCSW